MTCRCRSQEEHAQRAVENGRLSQQYKADKVFKENQELKRVHDARIVELQGRSPNPDAFHIDEVEQVGEHLVVRVEYPGCVKCSFDKKKVMVFLFVQLKDVLKWKRIDPHFRETTQTSKTEAPSPRARFPATEDGWREALEWAQWMQDKKR